MILVYVDAENVSFSCFHDFARANLRDKVIVGKAYGDSSVIGDNVKEYVRFGFEFFDTSILSSSQKNLTDMKIITDVAFDTMHGMFDRSQLSVVLITKDCDFMPLVYKLQGLGIPVMVPTLEAEVTKTVSRKRVTDALEKIDYRPTDSDDWMKPQLDFVYDKISKEIDYAVLDKYFARKRSVFIKSVTQINPAVAVALDTIPKHEFGIQSIIKVLNDNGVTGGAVINYVNLYTTKFFGKTFSSKRMDESLKKLYRR